MPPQPRRARSHRPPPRPAPGQRQPKGVPQSPPTLQPGDEVVTEPPAQKIINKKASFSGLDKITGRIINFDEDIGETVQFGALRVKTDACYTRPATEAANTDAFVEVDEITLQGEVKRIFSGWMFAASPGLHGVEHPIYDIWLTDCKGPETTVVTAQPDPPKPPPPPPPPAQKRAATAAGAASAAAAFSRRHRHRPRRSSNRAACSGFSGSRGIGRNAVIPGRAEREPGIHNHRCPCYRRNCHSFAQHRDLWLWIPGLRQEAHPGMTERWNALTRLLRDDLQRLRAADRMIERQLAEIRRRRRSPGRAARGSAAAGSRRRRSCADARSHIGCRARSKPPAISRATRCTSATLEASRPR